MQTIKLALTEAKAYFFYAKNCETGASSKLLFEDKEKGGLMVGTIVEVEVKQNGIGCSSAEYKFIRLISEQIPDGREKIMVDFAKYKSGDAYDGTVILGLGSAFVKGGKKLQYAYFR